MKTRAVRALSREAAIAFLIEKGIILLHEPGYIQPVPEYWEAFRLPATGGEDGLDYEQYIIQEYGKAISEGKNEEEALAKVRSSRLRVKVGVFDKEPNVDELTKEHGPVEVVHHPAHDRKIPERIQFDPAVLDTDGLLETASPITRTTKAAVVNEKGEVTTPAEMDPMFYAVIRFRSDEAGDLLDKALSTGGTTNTRFKLAERAEMKLERARLSADDPRKAVSEVRSVKIGDVTIFPVGGEDGMSADDLGRGYL